jgi:hypothetical protein
MNPAVDYRCDAYASNGSGYLSKPSASYYSTWRPPLVFLDEADHLRDRELLGHYVLQFGLGITAYCHMTNLFTSWEYRSEKI